MVLNDAKIYYAEGNVKSAEFTAEKVMKRVSSYSLPNEVIDSVERTYFNTEHVKKYGLGYSDMGEITITVDLDTDNMEQLKEIKQFMIDRKEIAFGYVVDETLKDLSVKWSGVITTFNDVDGDITPGINATASFTVKPNTRLEAFTEPEAV